MANYRTIRELKPYRGIKVFRLHKDGEFFYYAFEDDDQITVKSLKELKKKIDERITVVKQGDTVVIKPSWGGRDYRTVTAVSEDRKMVCVGKHWFNVDEVEIPNADDLKVIERNRRCKAAIEALTEVQYWLTNDEIEELERIAANHDV